METYTFLGYFPVQKTTDRMGNHVYYLIWLIRRLVLKNIVFAAATEVVLVRFSEDDKILKDLVYLEEEAGVGVGTPLERAVGTCAEGGLGNALCRRRRRRIEIPRRVDENDDYYRGSVYGIWPGSVGEEDRDSLDAGGGKTAEERGPPPPPLVIEAAGQKYAQTAQFRYLGGLVNEDGELTQEINHRSRAAWACIRRFSRELFDRPRAPWRLKVRLLRAEAMEALLYGCMTWAPRRDHYRLVRRTHHRLLLRVIGYRRERGTYRQLSYAQALKKTGCQSVEATIRQRRLLFAGAMARQPAGRLPKRLMDGKLVGGKDPGKVRPEQNWTDCLKDDFQAFGPTDGSTVDNRLTFGVDRAVWTLAAKMDDGAPWHKGVLKGAEKFMTS